jgi:hypothetical protein
MVDLPPWLSILSGKTRGPLKIMCKVYHLGYNFKVVRQLKDNSGESEIKQLTASVGSTTIAVSI